MLIFKLEKLSVIPNKNIPQTIWPAPVFRKDQLGLQLFIVPVREVKSKRLKQSLTLIWDAEYSTYTPQRFIAINIFSGMNGN